MTSLARRGRLAALTLRSGGVSADLAVAAAGARPAAIQDRTLAEIDDALASAVFGVAGLFGLETLGAVSYTLCELIDHLHATGAWRPAAVRLHADSLGLARHAGPGSAAQRTVLDGLRRVTDSVPPG